MNNNTPHITLCVLTYNRASDLENTIKSFLSQNYKNCELLIMDDASPDNTNKMVREWLKLDKRIKYIRNKKNIGLSSNFKKSFSYALGKYIIFLGDDDIFIDDNALKIYTEIFKHSNVGVVRSRQIIFRNWKVFQASRFKSKNNNYYNSGFSSFTSFIYDTTSIAGLAYINNKKVRSLLASDYSMYPQMELATKIALYYKCVQINKYLIGVQSHEGQLNVLSYKLNNKKSNILEDMENIYNRVNNIAKSNKFKFISKKQFMNNIISFLPLFLPYNTLKNGRENTLEFIGIMKNYNKDIYKNKLFLCSYIFIFMPIVFQKNMLNIINIIQLNRTLDLIRINKYNSVLSNYS